jgi:anti-sigma B factor antagonist
MSVVPLTSTDAFSLSVLCDRLDVTILPTGDVDLRSAPELETAVRDLIRAGFAVIAIDLRGVTFMDSSGLRVLLALRNDARRGGVQLELIPGAPRVQRIFELSGTRGVFAWRAAQAIAA